MLSPLLILLVATALSLTLLFLPAVINRLLGIDSGIPSSRHAQFGGVGTFIPEVWSKKILTSLKKAHVIGAPGVVNRDYEGEINEAGDTVHINSVGRPTISTYVPGSTTIVPEQLTTAQRSLVVDQAKYFAIEIDDVDKRQAHGGILEEATREGAYGLADVSDTYVEGILRAGVASANALGAVSVPAATPEDFYDDILIPLSVLLDESDVPAEGRYVLIPAWCHGRLRRDDRFIDYSKSGNDSQAMGNGMVGEAAGFSVRVSNNLPVVTGDDSSVIAGHPMAASFVEQINKTEAYRPESSFSDAVKGLHLYGAKVVRPTALATALASKT
jgi:hypothetical protein